MFYHIAALDPRRRPLFLLFVRDFLSRPVCTYGDSAVFMQTRTSGATIFVPKPPGDVA